MSKGIVEVKLYLQTGEIDLIDLDQLPTFIPIVKILPDFHDSEKQFLDHLLVQNEIDQDEYNTIKTNICHDFTSRYLGKVFYKENAIEGFQFVANQMTQKRIKPDLAVRLATNTWVIVEKDSLVYKGMRSVWSSSDGRQEKKYYSHGLLFSYKESFPVLVFNKKDSNLEEVFK